MLILIISITMEVIEMYINIILTLKVGNTNEYYFVQNKTIIIHYAKSTFMFQYCNSLQHFYAYKGCYIAIKMFTAQNNIQ